MDLLTDTKGCFATEARNERTMDIDTVDTLQMVRMINHESDHLTALIEMQSESIARAVDLIAGHLRQGGRLIYVGAGTSGRLGILDASECPPTFSVPAGMVVGLIAGGPKAILQAVENAEDDPGGAVSQLQGIHFGSKDVVCGIAASGRTPYVIGALRYARSIGAATICVTNNRHSPLAQVSDIPIEVEVGPEALTGSTRLKAGTAQKMVLNLLSTGAMIRLGKTYSNLMVDLSVSNEKLRCRCLRILRELFPGTPDAALEETLNKAGNHVKTAAVMQQFGCGAEEALDILAKADGRLRIALNR